MKAENSERSGLDAGGLNFFHIRIFDLFRDSSFGFRIYVIYLAQIARDFPVQ